VVVSELSVEALLNEREHSLRQTSVVRTDQHHHQADYDHELSVLIEQTKDFDDEIVSEEKEEAELEHFFRFQQMQLEVNEENEMQFH